MQTLVFILVVIYILCNAFGGAALLIGINGDWKVADRLFKAFIVFTIIFLITGLFGAFIVGAS